MNIDLKDKTVCLRNGRFTDVENGRYFDEKVSLIIKNDKITAIPANAAQEAIPADYEIDLMGKTVYPGLINTHSHIQQCTPSVIYTLKNIKLEKKHRNAQIEKRMRDCLAHGVTIVRDCGTFYHRLAENRALKERIEKGRIPGPKILQAVIVNIKGNYLSESLGFFIDMMTRLSGKGLKFSDPESPVVTFGKNAGEDKVRAAVDTAVDIRQADYIKLAEQKYNRLRLDRVVPQMSSDQMAWIVDQARRRGKMTTFHHIEADSFRHAIAAGIDSIAHMPFDSLLTEADAERFMASGAFIEPTLSGIAFPGIWELRSSDETADPIVRKILDLKKDKLEQIAETFWVPGLRDEMLSGIRRIRQGKLKTSLMDAHPFLLKFLKGAGNLVRNTNLLIKAGALSRMSIANDGGFLLSDADIATELDMINLCMELDGSRLSGSDALRIASINGARVLGLGESCGSIEKGKTADLAVIDGDPLNDYRCIGQPVSALFRNGRMVINNCGLQIKARIRLVSRSEKRAEKPVRSESDN